MMAETETTPSPVTKRTPRLSEVEAVQWDGAPEVLATLAEWGAEPWAEHPGGLLRVWGPRGYEGAFPGDWLVRDRSQQGATRYAPGAFADAFQDPAGPDPGELQARALLLEKAQDAIAFERERADKAEVIISDARETIASFLGQYGHSEIPMFKVAQDLANSLRETLVGQDALGLIDAEHEASPPETLSAGGVDEPLTHFFHCWRSPDHHRCAVALIERQSEENDRLLSRAASPERAAEAEPEEPKSTTREEGNPDA
jgi:hypothetical protein